jgi:8-oxo-dGTP pyrophosphatase MutT (NUDIX family)
MNISIGTIFVSVVIPISEIAFVLGKMSGHTSTPGVVQLPGGGISVESGRAEISYSDVVTTATDEVREELGIDLSPSSLRFIGIINREAPPDIGLVFTTDPHSWGDVVSAFSSLQEHERSTGAKSEFSEVLALNIDLPFSDDSYIDYLPTVVKALANRGSVQ